MRALMWMEQACAYCLAVAGCCLGLGTFFCLPAHPVLTERVLAWPAWAACVAYGAVLDRYVQLEMRIGAGPGVTVNN